MIRPNQSRHADVPRAQRAVRQLVSSGLMRHVVTIATCVLYVAGVLTSVPLAGAGISWALIAVWSAAFAWCHIALLHGRAFTAVSIVIVVTIVLPVVALIALAWPNLDFLWPAFEDRGALGGLEFLAPLIAALLYVLLAHRLRPRRGTRT